MELLTILELFRIIEEMSAGIVHDKYVFIIRVFSLSICCRSK